MTRTVTLFPQRCIGVFLAVLFVNSSSFSYGWVTSNNLQCATTSTSSSSIRSTSSGHRSCSLTHEITNQIASWKHQPIDFSRTKRSYCRLFAATSVEEDEGEVIYLDEENDDEDDDALVDDGSDYDPKAALEQQNQWILELEKLSQTTSNDPHAVSKAQAIFDDMFTKYVESDDATYFPTVEVYNLLIETHAFSKQLDSAQAAQDILDKMEDPNNVFVAKPNDETYRCVMDAWANRQQPQKARAIMERQGNDVPTETQNKLIQAYGMAGDLTQAEATFRDLLQAGKADHKSWVQLLRAHVAIYRRGNLPTENSKKEYNQSEEDIVLDYFQEMKDAGFEPQTDAYNAWIRSLGTTLQSSQRAEEILFEMIEGYREENDETIKPNTETFRAILGTYGKKKSYPRTAAAKVEQLLQIKEGLLYDNNEQQREGNVDDTIPRKDLIIYKQALEIVGRSKDSKKAARAERILNQYKKGNTGSGNRDLIFLVLRACAYTLGETTTEEKNEAFQVALRTFQEVRSSENELKLDSQLVGLFLQACHKLMPGGPKRDDVVTKVFQDACQKGLVNNFCLNELEQALSEDKQLELLGGFLVDGVNIPEAWSRNVQ